MDPVIGQPATASARERVRAFVKGTLGCNCADALFDAAAIEFAPPAPGALFEITVADRLLVRCYRVTSGLDLGRALDEWVAVGRAAREDKRMNRVRLVLAADRPENLADAAQAAFVACRGGDDRVHLHLLAPEALEPLFAQSC